MHRTKDHGVGAALVVALALGASGPPARAEEGPVPGDLSALSLEELMDVEVKTVTSASRFEQKLGEAPASVSVLTADEIRLFGWRNLADALRSVRSFLVTSDRSYSWVGFRGFGRTDDYNTHVLVLVDGHRMNDNIYENANLGDEFQLDLSVVERIEIVRGPSSSLYGSNAFFATVNVITRTVEGPTRGTLAVEVGSHRDLEGEGQLGGSLSAEDRYLLAGSYRVNGGQTPIYFPAYASGPSGGYAHDLDGEELGHAFLKFAHGAEREGLFTATGIYASRSKDYPTATYGTDFNTAPAFQRDTTTALDLRYEREFAAKGHLIARLFADDYRYGAAWPYSGVVNRDADEGRWIGTELLGTLPWGEVAQLAAGGEVRDNVRQDQHNYDENPPSNHLDVHQTSWVGGLFAEGEFRIPFSLALHLGLREDFSSTYGSAMSPRAALVYAPARATTLKAIIGRAYRAPSAYEDTYAAKQGVEVAPLLPERIATAELVLEQGLGERVRLVLDAFHNQIFNLITQQGSASSSAVVYANQGMVQALGVETEVEARASRALWARVSYALQEARNSSGALLPNCPVHQLKLNLSTPIVSERVRAGLEGQFIGPRLTDARRFLPAVYLMNLNVVARDVLPGLDLDGGVRNLLGRPYDDPASPLVYAMDSLPQDGLTFHLGARYRF